MKHFHIIIWAAEGKSETGYSGVTYVDLIVDSVNEALDRAKQLAPGRGFYYVNSIVEHHGYELDK